jgi:hypothetical protein
VLKNMKKKEQVKIKRNMGKNQRIKQKDREPRNGLEWVSGLRNEMK